MSDNTLPAHWEGAWQGNITVVKSDNTTETVVMRLTVEPVSETVRSWRIEYITDKQHSVREYEIAPGEAGNGHFVIDEKNGVLLDCRLFGNTLVSQFQVQGALLFSRCEHQGEAIAMEIVSFNASEPRRNVTDEESIEVLAYPCHAFQSGLLRRV